jgi:hypothetical protein
MIRNASVKEQPALLLSKRSPLTLIPAHEVVGRGVEFFGSPGLIERPVGVAKGFVVVDEAGFRVAEALVDVTFEEPGDLFSIIVFLLRKPVDKGGAVFADLCGQLEFRPRGHPLDRVVDSDVTG